VSGFSRTSSDVPPTGCISRASGAICIQKVAIWQQRRRLLTVVESGFDRIPFARRAEAYRGNEEGWAGQMKTIDAYVGKTP
jgi:hypothetical protein